MKKETKRKIKNVTIEIIDFFLGIPESFVSAFDRKEFYRLMQGRSQGKELTCSNIAQFISNLKRRGYIEVSKTKEHGESIVFTNKAKLAIIDKLAAQSLKNEKCCFVSFDIPETRRNGRDQFRRAIKRMGFIQIQQSLWANNRNVGSLVEMAAEEYEVNDYVVYLVAAITNIDAILNKKFPLNKP